MASALADRAATIGAGTPEPTHFVCCDDNRAVCGEDVSNHEPAGHVSAAAICPMCELIITQGVPCPTAGCSRSTSSINS